MAARPMSEGLDILASYWLDEFLVVLVASVVSILLVEAYTEHRRGARIEIKSIEHGDKLGFEINVKNRTLNHPRIFFYGGWARPERGFDFRPCELYDKDGYLYKDDFILVGRPVRILPMQAERTFEDEGESIRVRIAVKDVSTGREILKMAIPSLPKAHNLTGTYPKEPKVNPYHQVSIQITADGLERDELQRFRLGLEALILMQYPIAGPDATHVIPRLLIEREPWIMRRL